MIHYLITETLGPVALRAHLSPTLLGSTQVIANLLTLSIVVEPSDVIIGLAAD